MTWITLKGASLCSNCPSANAPIVGLAAVSSKVVFFTTKGACVALCAWGDFSGEQGCAVPIPARLSGPLALGCLMSPFLLSPSLVILLPSSIFPSSSVPLPLLPFSLSCFSAAAAAAAALHASICCCSSPCLPFPFSLLSSLPLHSSWAAGQPQALCRGTVQGCGMRGRQGPSLQCSHTATRMTAPSLLAPLLARPRLPRPARRVRRQVDGWA